MAWNLQGYPGPVNDDEGTYTAQAWAVLYEHHLAPYTYWYDHPPLGWATIAAWAWVSDGFNRLPRAVMVGREAMWIASMVSSTLVYTYARKIGLRRPSAVAAVLIFSLGPLDIWYHRMVSLDNLSTMWALAAFTVAASRRSSIAAAFWSGVLFAASTLSKETAVVLLPALAWQLWHHTERQTRIWNISIFCATYLLFICLYPLFALLRGELLPGPGHVSLFGSLLYQFITRQGTGSLMDVHSGTFALFESWVQLDPWIMLSGIAVIPIAIHIRKLRPAMLALIVQVAILFKGGYVPYAFCTAMLPFEALLIAGIADTFWGGSFRVHQDRQPGDPIRLRRASIFLGRSTVISALAVFVTFGAHSWVHPYLSQSRTNGFAAESAATAWVIKNVPANDIVVVDDYPWVDIKRKSRAIPLWLWKINSDPQVMRTLLPKGYRSISYMELDPSSSWAEAALPGRPTLQQALNHSRIVKRFGSVDIYKIVH